MLTWRAPGKINLFLHVVGRLNDGYHELQTAYQLLDWYDELEFELTTDGRIHRGGPIPEVAEADDITLRAARRLRDLRPGTEGTIIHCHKNLPVGAGLGGGSSDAATTLLALNEMWNLAMDVSELVDLGATIGADVPVFIRRRNALAEGRGERLVDFSISEQLYLVVYPGCLASTEQVFRAFIDTPFRERITIEKFYEYELYNDLEATTCRLYPEVRALIDWLKSWGTPRMTGAGSAVYLPIENREIGTTIQRQLPTRWISRVCVGQGS